MISRFMRIIKQPRLHNIYYTLIINIINKLCNSNELLNELILIGNLNHIGNINICKDY